MPSLRLTRNETEVAGSHRTGFWDEILDFFNVMECIRNLQLVMS